MHNAPKWTPTMQFEEYWTIKDFCGCIKAGKTTIWSGVKNGRLPKPIKVMGMTRWKRSEIEAFLQDLAAKRANK